MHYIAIEAGATRSRAALVHEDTLLAEAEGGPCNPVAYGWEASLNTLCSMVGEWARSNSECVILAGIAGAADQPSREYAAQQLANRLGHEARVTEDVWATLHANAAGKPAILVIAGTGSNTAGFDGKETWLQLGGRGHVFGDEGSAYAIGVAALRAVAAAEDGLATATSLTHAILTATGLSNSTALVAWSGRAGKARIAALAEVVAGAASDGDSVAAQIIKRCADDLILQTGALMKKLGLDADAIVLGHGGNFDHIAAYGEDFAIAFHAFRMAKVQGPHASLSLKELSAPPHWLACAWPLQDLRELPVTESAVHSQRLLDEMSPLEIAESIADGGIQSAQAVRDAAAQLAPVIKAAAGAISAGGRIFYVGAGTSGRLGVLDAAECPPTFGVSPERVQGILAGGLEALVRSIEGAEDDEAAGAAAMDSAGVGEKDVVIGIAASGNTPFVAAALARAQALGAPTAIITSNPQSKISAPHRVVLDTGPELLAGSTRMKAGTAAKIALNIISTGAMAQAGYVWRGRMIGMRPVNQKLRERAVKMVAELAGVEDRLAQDALEQCGFHIASAILVARDGLSAEEARAKCDNASSPRTVISTDREKSR